MEGLMFELYIFQGTFMVGWNPKLVSFVFNNLEAA